MRQPPFDDLEPYLARIRQLPFVRDVRVEASHPEPGPLQHDAHLTIDTPTGPVAMPVETKRSHLTRELGERLVHQAARVPNLLVLAPAIGRELGELFARERVNFMDLAGNCFIGLDDRYFARVQGIRSEAKAAVDKGMRAPAYRVLFAYLAAPDLVTATVRTAAEAAGGVSPQTVGSVRAHLLDRGILVRGGAGQRWAPTGRRAATDLFVAGFATTLLPSLVIGRYRARPNDTATLEAELSQSLHGLADWRWGGGAACQRLTGHFRGDRTVIYLERGDRALAKSLRLVPDPAGRILLAVRPGPLAFWSPREETVHPLLAYADLLLEGDERAREGAAEIHDRYLIAEMGDR